MPRLNFTPRPYQGQLMHWMHDLPKCAGWAGMGLGKTVSTLTVAQEQDLLLGGPTLILGPLRVVTSTWPDECRKWSHLSGYDVVPVTGNLAQRKLALAKRAPAYAINYEQLPWLVEHMGKAWRFKLIVADEATRLKGFRLKQGGIRAASLARVAHLPGTRLIELTGTPSPNGLQDLWGQAWFLDKGERLGRTFKAFADRWFTQHPSGYGLRAADFAQDQIMARLRDLCLSIDARDHFNIGEPIVNVVKVRLPEKARNLYRDMEREMFMSLEGSDVEAFNAAGRTLKCLQIANGAAYVDEGKAFHEVHDAKLQALESIVTEANGAPILVAYHFKSDLTRMLRAFPQGRALDQDPQTIRDWNAGRIPILFAHPASAGHGLNLQDGGNILVFFGHWWNLEEYMQIIERIGPTRQAQSGHNRPVFIHHIVAENTVDELVMARRDSKRSVQDILLDAMKRRTA